MVPPAPNLILCPEPISIGVSRLFAALTIQFVGKLRYLALLVHTVDGGVALNRLLGICRIGHVASRFNVFVLGCIFDQILFAV